MRRLSMMAGAFSVLAGVFLIGMVFGFASMVDPDVQGAARRSEIVHRMVTGGGSGLAFGLALIGVGLWLALSLTEPARLNPGPLDVAGSDRRSRSWSGAGPGGLRVEWAAGTRRWQTYAARSLFVAALLAGLVAVRWSRSDANFSTRADPGSAQVFFFTIVGIQLVLVMRAWPLRRRPG